MRTLFLAWQDPVGRRWYPVGRLTYDRDIYQFVYTHGAVEAQQNSNFRPLAPLDSLEKVYESEELLPLFANRLLATSRPDYREFVECLNIPQGKEDPIAILARTGGRRVTDSFEVFPCPEPDEEGRYRVHFFAHGLRHFPEACQRRILDLEVDERLLLMWDLQNEYDPGALMLRTNDQSAGDRYPVGYCPRYLVEDFFEVLKRDPDHLYVAVERVNRPPAPLQLRLLCGMTARWPADASRPFSSQQYQPIPGNANAVS